jgi:hypothetical protein
MHEEILLPTAKRLLPKLGGILKNGDWYMAGGTALALQCGHRQSLDFDWFSAHKFSSNLLKRQLSKIGKITVVSEDIGTLHIRLAGIRLSFLFYPYKLLRRLVSYQGVNLAAPADIGCMKLQAISSRGSRKDFFDLYVLLRVYSLKQLLDWFDKKYKGVKYNHLHLLKSLVYFVEAEREPNPILLERINWSEVKTELLKQMRSYLK